MPIDLEYVPRCSGAFVHDASVLADERVEQSRLAGVGLAVQHDTISSHEFRAVVGAFKQLCKLGMSVPQISKELRFVLFTDVFVWEVEARFDFA
jgi:hypothetical protein